MQQPIIQLDNISKRFGELDALKQVSLDIQSGEFLTLLGPSGCGKTTLLRMISGFETPDSGTVRIAGKAAHDLAPQERLVNTVFQHYALFPHMTVYDNVAFGLNCKALGKAEIEQRVTTELKRVHLDHLAHRKPEQLSGGQQQRIAIARAAVNKPLVLLLDEPLSALDYSLRKNMQVELKNLQRELGITFVLVTHDQEEALSMSDRVVVMNHGVIEQIGTPRKVYEQPANLHVAKFIGETNVFDCTVIAASQTNLVTQIEGLDFTLVNKGFSQGDRISVVIRPEDFQVWDTEELEGDTTGMIEAKVEQVIYKGSTVDLIIKTINGTRILASEFFDEEDEDLDYSRGEVVWVEWLLGWEVILPYEAS